MNRNTFFYTSLAMLLVGLMAVVVIMLIPMPGDKQAYSISGAEILPAHTHVDEVTHRKAGQRLTMINPEPIYIEVGELTDIRLTLELRDSQVQSVNLTPRADVGLVLAPADELYIPSEQNHIVFTSTVSVQAPGKYYLMLDASINAAEQSVKSLPVGVAIIAGGDQARQTKIANPNIDSSLHKLPAIETIEYK